MVFNEGLECNTHNTQYKTATYTVGSIFVMDIWHFNNWVFTAYQIIIISS